MTPFILVRCSCESWTEAPPSRPLVRRLARDLVAILVLVPPHALLGPASVVVLCAALFGPALILRAALFFLVSLVLRTAMLLCAAVGLG